MALTPDDLRHQHQRLLEQVTRIEAAVRVRRLETDAEAVRAMLETLAGHLSVHLEAEDHGLYPALARADDPVTRDTAERFSAEMGGLAGAFTRYMTAWPVHAIRGNSQRFAAESIATLAVLRQRIAREDAELYPLARGVTVTSRHRRDEAGPAERPVVCIVDDNEADFLLLQEAWREVATPIALEHYAHAERFLERLARPPRPDLAVVDVTMPVVDGLELLRRIRAQPAFATMPVVMCTSAERPAESAAAYAGGANGFFPKPATFDEYLPFVRTMNDLIAYHRPR